MNAVLNISAYKFLHLPDTAALRDKLHAEALTRGLKGTVLLAEEGINLFLAGAPEAVRGWVAQLQADARFADIAPKESISDTVPFKRLLVKIKREIIRMNRPAIRPAQGRAPALPAPTLARWLEQGHDDEGRPVVMLDTRNAFEVDAGAFEDAIDWRLQKFSDFPAALHENLDGLRDKTVVSYCTGGIRCEKAALLMQDAGLPRVWQLEGGILKYFEETSAPRWRGACFVFDERIGLAPDLQPAA
ncbi:sulfurtransferase [Azohydromonas caseinilytica]|uniref:Sulfurtransferase n=1 Tax=Azohydromonas caseinilytica TaxID=2728836 RepID=A0A848F7D1_9BURK|nr:sulfurtransferase [Azohydromonas caseinilytica]NML14160.1 sulfurtransferase [Azohydromonas caseinilytica]